MQPLDVGVFGPKKRHWQEILRDWKEECSRKDIHFAALPKTVRTVQYILGTDTFISEMHPPSLQIFFYYLGTFVVSQKEITKE
jgi:hypothetical protein